MLKRENSSEGAQEGVLKRECSRGCVKWSAHKGLLKKWCSRGSGKEVVLKRVCSKGVALKGES